MRRFSAALLLVLFSTSLIQAALYSSDSDSRLPACCRRLGKHRCGMADAPAAGDGLKAARCASFPSTGIAPVVRPVAIARPLSTAGALCVYGAAAIAQTRSLQGRIVNDAHFERGPPHFLG